jgi:hypothetical protein
MGIGLGKGVWMANQGPLVDFTDVSHSTVDTPGTVYARVKWDTDGDIYESFASGTYGSSSDTWLDRGLNSQVWVQRVISSGTLNLDTIGASRVAMTSDRQLGVERSPTGSKAANGTISFYDAASGGNLLRTRNWSVSATVI